VCLVVSNIVRRAQLTYRLGDMVAPTLSNVEPLLVEIDHFSECSISGQRRARYGALRSESCSSPGRRGQEFFKRRRAWVRRWWNWTRGL